MKRTPLRRVSAKRAIQNREYTRERLRYLALHPWCEWFIRFHGLTEDQVRMHDGYVPRLQIMDNGVGFRTIIAVPRSDEIHHRKGRFGSRLLDKEWWMAVSREGHNHIHKNTKESYELGYLLPR